jgi:hypothetical protein
MLDVSNQFLRPNLDDRYYAQQSQILFGLWTPYGVVSPMHMGIWPDGSVDITYNLQNDAKFYDVQKRKIKYVEKRGVKVHVMHISPEVDNG